MQSAWSWNLRTCPRNEQDGQICAVKCTVSSFVCWYNMRYWHCQNLNKQWKLNVYTYLYRNSGAQNWSPSKQRFENRDRHTRLMPGPGAYEPSDVDSSRGSYITSNFKNTANNVRIVPPPKFISQRSKTPAINRQSKWDNTGDLAFCSYLLNVLFKRIIISRIKWRCLPRTVANYATYTFCLVTPGPGSYILPSDFGYPMDNNKAALIEPNSATKFMGRARIPHTPATPAARPRLVSRL